MDKFQRSGVAADDVRSSNCLRAIRYDRGVSSYTQLALGLRSLAVKIIIFVILAGGFAWLIGGSIFPGSQVVNLPTFSWGNRQWHLRVTGNGRKPAPVSWELIANDGQSETKETLGVTGTWDSIEGPVFDATTMGFAIRTSGDGSSAWWIASVDLSGNVLARKASELEAQSLLRPGH